MNQENFDRLELQDFKARMENSMLKERIKHMQLAIDNLIKLNSELSTEYKILFNTVKEIHNVSKHKELVSVYVKTKRILEGGSFVK